MKKSLSICVVVLSVALITWPVSAHSDAAHTELTDLFERYTAIWNRGDLMAIGTEIYQTPIQIFEDEKTVTLASPADIAALLQALRRTLDQAGFSHSELRGVSVCELGPNLALASYHYSRIDKQGVASPVLASAYIARHTAQGWRLVAHIMQAQVRALSCDAY